LWRKDGASLVMKSGEIVGIYRERARAAARREEEQGTRGDDGCEDDPRDERQVKRQPLDGIGGSTTCSRWVLGRSNRGGPSMHGTRLYILPDVSRSNSFALNRFL
jgi:hypothetical protein